MAGRHKAVFRGPKGIRCDAAGNLYVVDCENHSVRRIDVSSGVIRTVAGGQRGPGGDGGPATAAGLARPHGCILDGAGTLYIADSENFRVRHSPAGEMSVGKKAQPPRWSRRLGEKNPEGCRSQGG